MHRDVFAPIAAVAAVLLCCGTGLVVGGAIASWTVAEVLGVSAGLAVVAVAGAVAGASLIRRKT